MDRASPVYSVPEAARELGVSESRVKALIAAGQLEAEKFAGRWMVDPASLHRRKKNSPGGGRPLSPRRTWALISGPLLPELLRHANDHAREAIRLQLGNRAQIQLAFVHPQLASKVRAHFQFPAGRELAERAGVAAGRDGRWALDGYILASNVHELEHNGLTGHRGEPNVRLRVIDDDAMANLESPDLTDQPIAQLLVAWADLADDDDRAADMTLSALLDAVGRLAPNEPLPPVTEAFLTGTGLGRLFDVLGATGPAGSSS